MAPPQIDRGGATLLKVGASFSRDALVHHIDPLRKVFDSVHQLAFVSSVPFGHSRYLSFEVTHTRGPSHRLCEEASEDGKATRKLLSLFAKGHGSAGGPRWAGFRYALVVDNSRRFIPAAEIFEQRGEVKDLLLIFFKVGGAR